MGKMGKSVEEPSDGKKALCVVKSAHTEVNGTKALGVALRPMWSYPIGHGAWDPVSATLLRLDVLYEYAAATGDLSEVQRIGEEMARLVEQL